MNQPWRTLAVDVHGDEEGLELGLSEGTVVT